MALFQQRQTAPNVFKVLVLPERPIPNAVYYVLKSGYCEEWVTDVKGVAVQVKSEAPGGGDIGEGGDFVFTLEAAQTIIKGQPVLVTNQSKLVLADAGSYSNARCAGLANANTSTGFACPVERSLVSLLDWTGISDGQHLTPGAKYFLGVTPGTISSTPPAAAGQCVQVIGEAVSTAALVIEISDPIQL